MVKIATDNLVRHIQSEEGVELSPPQLRQLQRTLLMIADDVIECCKKEGLRYTLVGGTCLGAIRHRGFIPWDDDIDLALPRRDYNRFIQVFSKLYKEKYWVFHPEESEGHGLPLARIELKGTRVRSLSNIGSHTRCGASIDIFILENAPNNFIIRKIHENICMLFGLLLSCRRYYEYRNDYLSSLTKGSDVERAIRLKSKIGSVISFASLDFWTRVTDRIHSSCHNDNTIYVVIPGGRGHYAGEIYRRDDFLPTKSASFEERNWDVPGNVDAYLSQLYGSDYMDIPPIEAREKHFLFEFDLGEYSDCSGDDCGYE